VQKSIIIGARPGLFDASRRAGGGGAAAAAEEEDGVSLGELSREEPGLGDRGGLRAVGFAIATWGADFFDFDTRRTLVSALTFDDEEP